MRSLVILSNEASAQVLLTGNGSRDDSKVLIQEGENRRQGGSLRCTIKQVTDDRNGASAENVGAKQRAESLIGSRCCCLDVGTHVEVNI